MDPDALNQRQHLIPPDVLAELLITLAPSKRAWLRATEHYPRGSVGELISPDVVVVGADATIKTALRTFRQLEKVPDQTDQAVIVVPAAMHSLGRNPAFGSSVLLTFTTDSMGFFIFLGLATVLLLH